jgi:hypothetical protein
MDYEQFYQQFATIFNTHFGTISLPEGGIVAEKDKHGNLKITIGARHILLDMYGELVGAGNKT